MINKVFRSKRSVKESRHSRQPVSPLLRPTSRRHDVSHGTRSAPAIYITRIERPPPALTKRESAAGAPPHTHVSGRRAKKRESQTTTRRNQQTGLRGERRGRDEMSVLYGQGPASRAVDSATDRAGRHTCGGTARTRENATRTDCTQKRSCEKGGHTEREKEQKEGEQHGSKRVAHRG